MSHRQPSACLLALVILARWGTGWALEKEVSLVTGRPIGELAVAGRLSVDLHAEFMLARTYDRDTALNWYNCGYSGGGSFNSVGGTFGNFGLDVPWTERDAKYPHAVKVGTTPAVRFDGNDTMKSNWSVEACLVGGSAMALELWLRDEKPGKDEVILGWQSPDGTSTSASVRYPETFSGSDRWRHLVINCASDREDWYVDGQKVASGKRTFRIAEGHRMVLGGASADKPSFEGDLAAVRLHDAAMTEEEIAHNFKGGVMLGTEMHNWWRLEPDKWWVQESAHFRHCVDRKEEMDKWNAKQRKEFEDRVPGMFKLAELIYRTYSERLAMRSSVVSRRPEKRGDGIKYKTPIQPAGGSFMGCDDDFGWACQGAGFINPHELVHGWQAMTGGAMQGNWWEAHANFPQTYNGIYQTDPPACVSRVCAYFPAHGRSYYHDRLMFEHLAQSPEYGPMFIAKLWYDGATKDDKTPYPWDSFTRLDPDPQTPLACEYLKMVQRNVTWDYQTYEEARNGSQGNTEFGNDRVLRATNRYQEDAQRNRADILRYSRILLERIPYEREWYRVPKQMAPQQLGWNICPLKFQGEKATAELAGYVNPKRGGDWRFAFVGVDAQGKPVYGEIGAPGQTLAFPTANVKELYLTVCAIPTKIMAIDMVGDFRSFEQEVFPYKVKLNGCEPLNVLLPEKPSVAGAPHANGGGFVDRRAQVDASAYVGPNAQVLGDSKVLDNARIEDYAIVQDSTVRDRAVVSGFALVTNGSVVQDRAKVRDFARVWKATIKDRARVLEHAEQREKPCGGNATLKGGAISFGPVSGNSLIDGSYCKGNTVDKGKWFTWSWGQGRNPGEIDEELGGLYLRMTFEQAHPWMAADDFGTTWGYLVNGAKIVDDPARLRYESAVDIDETIGSLEPQANLADHYGQEIVGYLHPPQTGEYTFWISSDDEGQVWLNKDGTDPAGAVKIASMAPWTHPGNFEASPDQKSAPVQLTAGKAYYLKVLHKEGAGGDHVQVAWTPPGGKREIIGGQNLSVEPNGEKGKIRRRVWRGVNGDKIEALLKDPRYPEGRTRIEGGVLALDGNNQFVELQRDVADLRDMTIKLTLNWQGKSEERILEFFNEQGDSVSLSPSAGGKCVFAIRKGEKRETIEGPALPHDRWVEVAVVLSDEAGTLLVNGDEAGRNAAMTLRPEDVRATQCYLGRGQQGGFFKGKIERFEIYSVALDGGEAKSVTATDRMPK